MRPTVYDLHHSKEYELTESFHIDDMGKFLSRELGIKQPEKPATKPKITSKSILLFLLMLAVGGIVGWGIGKYLKSGNLPDTAFTQLIWAFPAFFLALLPLHEVIHGIVFKALGAEKVGFGWSVKSMIVYAYAQRFVITLRENAWVAVMPFLIITVSIISLWYFFPQWLVFWGASLFLHTTACIGDFILIAYYLKSKPHLIYTYDDIEIENRSYFFRKKPV